MRPIFQISEPAGGPWPVIVWFLLVLLAFLSVRLHGKSDGTKPTQTPVPTMAPMEKCTNDMGCWS